MLPAEYVSRFTNHLGYEFQGGREQGVTGAIPLPPIILPKEKREQKQKQTIYHCTVASPLDF